MRIVEKASEGWYDDYESPLPFPTMTLVAELRATRMAGMLAFAKRVKQGEFDATREEADEWARRTAAMRKLHGS